MRCDAITKKGKQCTRAALEGHATCLSHASKEVKESRGFGGAQKGAGRPKQPRVVDLLREKLDEHADQVLQVFVDAMTADRGVVVGNGPEAHVEYVPDHPTRIRAAESYLDRVVGKPRQAVEVTGAEGQPLIPPALPTGADWDRDLQNVLRDLEAPAASNGSNGNGNGHH